MWGWKITWDGSRSMLPVVHVGKLWREKSRKLRGRKGNQQGRKRRNVERKKQPGRKKIDVERKIVEERGEGERERVKRGTSSVLLLVLFEQYLNYLVYILYYRVTQSFKKSHVQQTEGSYQRRKKREIVGILKKQRGGGVYPNPTSFVIWPSDFLHAKIIVTRPSLNHFPQNKSKSDISGSFIKLH